MSPRPSAQRLIKRPRFSRVTLGLAVFVALTVAVAGSAIYRNYHSFAAGGWQSGASGEGVPDGRFASWRGSPVYIAGTWSPYALDVGAEYGSWNGDLDVGVYGAGSPDNGPISWSSAASGGADSIWDGEFNLVKGWLGRHAGRTVYMRFAYEYNGNWDNGNGTRGMPYNVYSGDISNFITAFRRWAAKCHAISGCKTVWANNEGSGGAYNPTTAYPGDQYVDVVGVDSYNQYPYSDSVSSFQANRLNPPMSTGESGLEAWRAFAQSHGKPMSIPEWANCSNSGGGGGGGDSPGYIQGMHDWMAANAGSGPGQIIYDVYFNVTSGYSCNFYLYPNNSAQPNAANMYKSLNWGNGGLGSGGGGTGPTPAPTPVPTPTPVVSGAGNLLSGKAFSSTVPDSTTETGHPISYVNDGNTSTRWISQPTSPVSITADMGASYTLTKVSVQWAGDTINHFQIQLSSDNATWTTIVSGQTNNTSPQYADYTSFSATPTGRYFRVVGTDRWNSSYGNSIWEIGAYGSAAGDKTPPSITITAPPPGAGIHGTTAITGNANDNVAVAKVDLLIDGAVKATNTSNNANFSWNSASVGDGPHTIALRATDTAGLATTSATINVTVTNSGSVPPPSIQSFTATPASVTSGGRSTLNWVTSGTVSCSVNPGGPQGSTATSWQTPSLTNSVNYTLVCSNSAGAQTSQTASVSVTSPTTPPIKPLLVASSTIIPSGNSVTLSWSAPGATNCNLSPGSISGTGATGSYIASNITSNTTYTVTCMNSVGSVSSDPVTVTVSGSTVQASAPAIVSLFADPARISNGQSSTVYWSTTGVPAGGCALNPSPLSSTNPNGSWTTPYLSASQSYTLACVGSNGDVVVKSTSVIVDGISVSGNAATVTPTTNVANSSQSVITASNGQQVTNGAVAQSVSGLVTLDPSNITSSSKEKSITRVEYYEGQTLLQTDSIAPFTLDSTKLSNGTHTITERTYYIDGSRSEVVRVLSVNNKAKSVANKSASPIGAALIISLVVVLGIVGGIMYVILRHRPTITSLRAKYGNTIDTSLLDNH